MLAAFSLVIGFLILTDYSYAQKGAAAESSRRKTPPKTANSKREEAEKLERAEKARKAAQARLTQANKQEGPIVMPMEFHGVSDSLTDIARKPQRRLRVEDGPFMENEREELYEEPQAPVNNLLPEFIQNETTSPLAATLGISFEAPGEGMTGYNATVAPPDTTLAVGPNHVVAWVNSHYAVFDKSGNKLLPGNGFVTGNSLFSSLGAGSLCSTTNRGDPILQYDRLANRWILSQFAFNVSGTSLLSPYLQCVAVSTSGDPTGTYNLYTISFNAVSPSGFNDYGKLGVMPEAYYTAYNTFGGSPAGGNTAATLCASDRMKMLAGDPTAQTVCFVGTYAGGSFGFLPADLDGTATPTVTNQGGIFMRFSTAPALRMLKLKPDFTVPANSTLTDGFGGAAGSFVNLALAATNRACNGGGGTCVAQPGTTTVLDTLGDRLMYRLAFRNRGGVESLLVNQSVDPDGAGTRGAAVRWYEVRNPFGNPADPDTTKRPVIFQSGTYDPGATGDRWMGSMAMDKFGNILMNYSLVNSATGLKPSIAITGRLPSDALNTMQAETIAFTGNGVQTCCSGGNPLTRWGDYTTMQVDPSDDATFWFIGQYLAADGVFNWNTRVFSYKFLSTIGGNVTYLIAPAKNVQSATLSTTGDLAANASTNAAGAYSLSNLSTSGSYTVTPSKTTNVNGITAFDATLVLRHVAAAGIGPNALSANQQLAADADGIGGVTSFDATLILRFVAANGPTANTGQTGTWKFSPANRSYSPLTTSPGAENYSGILIGEVNGDWIP